MELVEGKTLNDMIAASGMPIARFVEIAIQIADALTAAHQKQITHRDLKPGNVMVTHDGRVKVLDFGLARVGGSDAGEHSLMATQAPITHQGMLVGTMPYMSPEQVEGRVLDARSDLFSLGVMFYEMLGGSRPFAGPSSPALMSAILRDHAPLLTDRRAEVPEALARLVARCLEKHPEERVQTARDVYNELRHVQKQLESGFRRTASSGTVAGDAEASLWIAVLPFGARSSDAETEALAAGLTEDITSGLSRFPALSVIAPQSAAAFRNSPLDVRQIAERLGARYVLGGTARKSAGAVRVAAHLVDARSGAHLWTDTYDQPLERTDLSPSRTTSRIASSRRSPTKPASWRDRWCRHCGSSPWSSSARVSRSSAAGCSSGIRCPASTPKCEGPWSTTSMPIPATRTSGPNSPTSTSASTRCSSIRCPMRSAARCERRAGPSRSILATRKVGRWSR
jgi:serine/threonine-protein kinase